MKKLILNADDLGYSEFNNNAVLEAHKKGFLKSASIIPNMPFFQDAIKRVVHPNPSLGVGIHLNVCEGKPLSLNVDMLTDKNGNFNNSFLNLLYKTENKKFMLQLEKEFSSQIEQAKKYFLPTHIDSHIHIHNIPKIFNLVCQLAVAYDIPYIRTAAEKPYCIKDTNIKKYSINLIKNAILNNFTLQNKINLRNYTLQTNDYILGICYTGMMTAESIIKGLEKVKYESTVEVIIHPKMYYEDISDNHTKELNLTKNLILKEEIENLGFNISSYIDLKD